jgi:hypothetical protein
MVIFDASRYRISKRHTDIYMYIHIISFRMLVIKILKYMIAAWYDTYADACRRFELLSIKF